MVRVFRIKGEVRKWLFRTRFSVELTAYNEAHALEKLYSEMGSRHRLKRRHIRVLEVREISPEEVSDENLRRFLQLDKLVVV